MKKILVIGAGNRTYELFIKPLKTEIYSNARIVGLYDINKHRADLLSSYAPYDIPVYRDFEKAICNRDVDIFVVMTPDYTHIPIIKKILAYSKAIIVCEKPICISMTEVNYLMNLPEKQQGRIRVLLNSRFMPVNYAIKNLLDSKLIGLPLHVNYNWNIDVHHGSEYLRRWHSDINKSGGMLVHKSCHHFDLLNWWLNDVPKTVSAFGNKSFFVKEQDYGNNCRECIQNCEFRMDLSHQELINDLYFKMEKYDGYIRDKCIFKNVTIDDTMGILIKYKKNIVVSYTLNIYAPKTSWYLSIVGTKGSISLEYKSGKQENIINIKLLSGKEQKITIPQNLMKHEGADLTIRKILFSDNTSLSDGITIGNMKDGVSASIIGILANKSMREGKQYEL